MLLLDHGAQADDIQPHGDGSLTPLSGLAIPPNVTRTWPFLLIISLIARIISALPEFAQSSLPAYLRPAPPIHPAEDDVDDGREAEAQTARLRAAAMRNSRRLRNSTPKDSPATTELESDASEEEGEVENGDAGGEGRKKKRGPGKAVGLRRRKMALKR